MYDFSDEHQRPITGLHLAGILLALNCITTLCGTAVLYWVYR